MKEIFSELYKLIYVIVVASAAYAVSKSVGVGIIVAMFMVLIVEIREYNAEKINCLQKINQNTEMLIKQLDWLKRDKM